MKVLQSRHSVLLNPARSASSTAVFMVYAEAWLIWGTSMRFFPILLLALASAPLAARNVGAPAPDFVFEHSWNLPPGASSLSGLRGHTVLLEFWATW
jgi:hypothetical protein